MESVVWCGRNCCWPLKAGWDEMNNSITWLHMSAAHGVGPIAKSHISWKLRGKIFIAAREEATRNPAFECPGENKSFFNVL